ncbi:MAG TPA: helix-turn-helix domain-containing protein [Candidatus Cybelea sp.]|nr:helix-turn-helix domain-containing protein [Candidatus Cybelea sp.]
MEDEGRTSGSSDFGKLLRHHRLAAGLSQEALAERARMSSDGISALERGHRRTPQRETLALLAGALALDDEQRRALEAAAARAALRGAREAKVAASEPETPTSGLPLSLTSFVGRDAELEEVVTLVRRHRLVTLTGSGGVGKTQMALQAGAALSAGEDIRFIGLAPLGSPSRVVPAIASALGVQELPNRALLETLLAHLKERSMLLILDNCEHVIAQAAIAADELLAGCPHVRILATSREPLRVAGERSYRLPSLRIPSPDVAAGLSATDAVEYGAIALFCDRARAVDYRFALTGENAPIVAELCRHLDGIPLAIELAAARVNLLSVKALNAMLDGRFRILAGGERGALPRQQTMRGAIDWSYDLLSAPEQRAFERLSIFPGGCTLRAAALVCGEKTTEDVVDILASLIDKSLLTSDFEGSEPRYRLLESFRQYALEKLDARGEREAVSRLHALASLELAETLDRAYDPRPNDTGPQTSATMTEPWAYDVEPELENARAAIAWALSADEVSIASRITCGFARIWRVNRGDAEPRRWLDAVLSRLDGVAEPGVAAQAWRTLSSQTFGTQKIEAAQRALELATECDDAFERVVSLYHISVGLLHAGRTQEAEAANDLALQICREGGPKWSRRYVTALGLRASIAQRGGRVDEARQLYAEALALTTAHGGSLEATAIRGDLAELEFSAGNPARALEFAEAAAAAARQARAKRVETSALANAAAYQLVLGDIGGARLAAREALALAQSAHPMNVAIATQHLATVAALRGDARCGARLRGYVDAWYSAEGCERDVTERRTYDILMNALRERLAGDEIEALAAEGALLSEEQAVLAAFAVTS